MAETTAIRKGAILRLPLYPKSGDTGYFWGRVIYVHPQCRFFVAEFEFEGRTVRESYCRYGKLAAWAGE